MTRQQAIETAAALFVKMNRALWVDGWTNTAAIEAAHNYRHGWMQVGDYSLSSDEFSPGARQPYWD